MNAITRTLIHFAPLALAATAAAQVAPADLINSVTQSDTGYQIAERGQDFAVVRKVTTTTDAAGTTAFGTNEFTLLENGLHYFADEQWKVSEDIIEAFPGGAIASRGPYKTIFSPDLNAEAVFDIQTPEGQRIRGGVLEQSSRDSIPDTMGAVGPSHFMEILNGSSSPSVAVYDKYSGAVRATATPETLFSVTVPSGPYAGSYPTGPIDSRLIFDHQSQRWIASTIDAVFGHVVLAVSNSPDPVGNGGATWVADNWKKYLVPFGTNCGTDFDILGVDGNGIYITATTAQSCNGNVAALPKSPLVNYDPTNPPPVVQDRHILRAPLGDYVFPAVNFDPVTTNDPIWFIAATSGSIYYNSLKWTGGFSNPPVWQFASPSPSLAITPSFATPLPAPQLAGGSHKVSVRLLSALMTASARSVGGVQYVWACRTIAVNRSGNADGGGVDRNAVEWFKIQMTPNVSIVASNRIYDTAVTSPNFYYMPSLAVNKNGDVVTGFSGSSVNDYIGAYYSGMLASGNSPSPPIRYCAGKDWFGGPFGSFPAWGDYSYTSLDPDGLTIWTIQEYAETRYDPQLFDAFGTRIAAITPF